MATTAALAWDPLAIAGLAAIVVSWAAAVLVYATGPTRAQNRLLAVVLVSEGTAVGFARGVGYLTSDLPTLHGLAAVVTNLEVVASVAYLLLLATLDSPLTRPLRPRWVRAGLVAAGLAWMLYMNLGPLPMWPTVYMINFETFTYVGVFGFAVGLSAWWRAPRGSWRRRQGASYAVAFGWRDLTWFAYLHLVFPTWGGQQGPTWSVFFASFAPSITIIFVVLLVYAILRTQLFDIDLRVKWTVRRGTVAAIFVGTFVVAFAVAEQYLQQFGVLFGGVAVGLLLLAFRPIERAAERIADHAMPRVSDTPAYVAFRKMEVYKAALEEVTSDGAVSEKDRRVLERLRTQLGLAEADTRALERDLGASS